MFPDSLARLAGAQPELLWFATLAIDLACTVLLFRLFGKVGLQVAIAVAIILANLQGPKLTEIFGLQTSLGVIFYSSIFFATDVLSENYGRREAEKAVHMGFAVSLIVLLMMSIALLYPPSTRPESAGFSREVHEAFGTIVDFTPRFVFGSLLAYYLSQRFDVWAFHRIRRATGERWLWLRNNLSTMGSQALDTLIYSLVAWWGVVDLATALALGASKYVLKLVIAAFDTLFIYWARSLYRRKLVPSGA